MTINWEEVDWEDLVKRLVLYTLGRMKNIVWHNSPGSLVPGFKQPQDFVQEAIIKTMSGQRKWDPLKVSLFNHLAGVISSEISHLAESLENKLTDANEKASCEEDDEKFSDKIVNLRDYRNTPEQDIIEEEEKANFLNYLQDLDSNFAILADLMLSGFTSSIDLSKKLDIPIENINNLKKRLKRATSSYLDEQKRHQA